VAKRLVVLIATAGRPALLARALNSLAACRKPEIYVETVVVENGEKLGVEEIVRNLRPVLNARYMHIPGRNKSGALNAALDQLPDCLIYFTDDDARFGPDTLCAYAEASAGIEGNAFFGGPLSVDYIQEPPGWLINYLPASARGWQPNQGPMAGQGWFFIGPNWAAFSGDLKNIGGFSEHIGPGSSSGATGQESEAQMRLLRAGCARRYVPEAQAWHFVPVERCSPEWAIQRFRQQGVSLAARLWQRGGLDSAALRCVELAKRVPDLAVSLSRPDAPYDFRLRYVRAYWDGFRDGVNIFRGKRAARRINAPIACGNDARR
jgi:GT2 family glycosyltransferase